MPIGIVEPTPCWGASAAWPGERSLASLREGRDMLERLQVADVAQVYGLCNGVAAALNDGGLERWISFWIDDAIQMPPGARIRIGKAQIRRAMQSLLSHFDLCRMIIHPEEVRILGDWAYVHGTYGFELVPRQGGETRRHAGGFLAILQKQVDGSWKIAVDCHNYGAPSEHGGGGARQVRPHKGIRGLSGAASTVSLKRKEGE
jgi:uncharacterized protein (TIGR02246 family)